MKARLVSRESSLRTILRLRFIVLAALGSLALAYAGSYYRLSRRGMQEAQSCGMPGFLYVPFAEVAASRDLKRHYALMSFYAPLNWVDRAISGAPGPCICVMWLSG